MQAVKLGFLVTSLAVVLTACSFPKTPEAKASWFFDKGQDVIMDSLSDQHLSDQKMEAAREVIKKHRPRVISALSQAFRAEHDTFRAIYSGEDRPALTAQGGRLHQAQQTTLQAIGNMHEDLANAVGRKAWNAASAERRADFRDRFD